MLDVIHMYLSLGAGILDDVAVYIPVLGYLPCWTASALLLCELCHRQRCHVVDIVRASTV